MAHEIENMFFVGETPWHGLGQRLIEAPNTSTAIVAAGLDWNVEERPCFINAPIISGVQTLPGIMATQQVQVPAKALIRSTDNSVLGVVGERYVPLQNKDAFNFFDPFVENGFVDLETAGSLRDGQRVWILARIKDNSDLGIVGDDAVRKFIMLSNSHDGTMAIRVGFTPVRIVCANTLAMAVGHGESSLLRIRHSKSAKLALDACREAMNLANQSFETTAENYRAMARRQVNENDLRNYVKIVLGHDKTKDEDLSTRASNQIDTVVRLFEFGRGQQLTGVKGTAWAAYNAVTEYLTHEAGDNADKRYNSLWFGANASRNKLAFDEALKLAVAA